LKDADEDERIILKRVFSRVREHACVFYYCGSV